jgi:hypothetical protein
MADAESDEDDYVFYGTSLQDEGDNTAAAAGSKKDPALTRYACSELTATAAAQQACRTRYMLLLP